MRLCNETLVILRNFSSINPSLLFKPGNVLTTTSTTKTVMARATVAETFPSQFAIYDLSKLIGVLSLFKTPDLQMNSGHLTIREGKQSVNYTYADPSTIVAPPDKEIKFPSHEVEFQLSAGNLNAIQRAIATLQLPEVAICGDRSVLSIQTVNSKNPTSDLYRIDLGETTHQFRLIFKVDNLKMINENYIVKATSKGIAHFKTTGEPPAYQVEYWVATESNSTFER